MLPLALVAYGILIAINADSIFYINKPYLIPEAFRYYEDYGFLTGSMGYGSIFQLSLESESESLNSSNPMNFTANVFFSHPNLTTSFGFGIDNNTNLLFICHATADILPDPYATGYTPSDWPQSKFMGGVMIVDLETMQMIQNIDFKDYNYNQDNKTFHAANDLVFDSEGNAFVTDSLAGIVYKLIYNNNDTMFSVEIISYREEWLIYDTFLDGIVLDPKNEEFLIVNSFAYSEQFKIYLNNNNNNMDMLTNSVNVNYSNVGIFPPGFDGQIFSADGKYLFVANNQINTIYQFMTDDNWNTMYLYQALPTIYDQPTSVQLASGGDYGTGNIYSVYVCSAFFSGIPSNNYPIQLLYFGDDNIPTIQPTMAPTTNGDDNGGSNGNNDNSNNNDVLLYILIGVSTFLFIALIISIVFIVRLRKQGARSANFDYQTM